MLHTKTLLHSRQYEKWHSSVMGSKPNRGGILNLLAVEALQEEE